MTVSQVRSRRVCCVAGARKSLGIAPKLYESRGKIEAKNGEFIDCFGCAEVHVYRIGR